MKTSLYRFVYGNNSKKSEFSMNFQMLIDSPVRGFTIVHLVHRLLMKIHPRDIQRDREYENG